MVDLGSHLSVATLAVVWVDTVLPHSLAVSETEDACLRP